MTVAETGPPPVEHGTEPGTGVPEPQTAPDITSFGIEYSPNFAASDLSEVEFIEESLGKVEPARGSETIAAPPEPANQAGLCNLLMELLIRELKK